MDDESIVKDATNVLDKIKEVKNLNDIYPVTIELYSGTDVVITKIIEKKSVSAPQTEIDLLPNRGAFANIYDKDKDNQKYGLSQYPRKWVSLEDGNPYYCSFREKKDKDGYILFCKNPTGEKTMTGFTDKKIRNSQFLDIEKQGVEKLCTCIDPENANDKIKLKCAHIINPSSGDNDPTITDINIPNINTCDLLMKNDKLLDNYLKDHKLSYCYDKHTNINNSERYRINAAYKNINNSLILFKNILINDKSNILFCEIQDIDKPSKYNKICLVNDQTFPGFDFDNKRIDSIIQINKTEIYLLQYTKGILDCILYDISTNYKKCNKQSKIKYIYPISFSIEFNYTFDKDKIIGGFEYKHIIYFFTKNSYLLYDLVTMQPKRRLVNITSSNSIFKEQITYKKNGDSYLTSVFKFDNLRYLMRY